MERYLFIKNYWGLVVIDDGIMVYLLGIIGGLTVIDMVYVRSLMIFGGFFWGFIIVGIYYKALRVFIFLWGLIIIRGDYVLFVE